MSTIYVIIICNCFTQVRGVVDPEPADFEIQNQQSTHLHVFWEVGGNLEEILMDM